MIYYLKYIKILIYIFENSLLGINMVRTETPVCNFNQPAIDFNLKGVDGNYYSLDSLKGQNGLLIMFICNHCPYVKSVIHRIIRDTKELKGLGVNSAAIMSNDPSANEDDSFENMQKIAIKMNFPFPYLIDKDQDVARAYDAQCTPDLYLLNHQSELVYHGRLDDNWQNPDQVTKEELKEAIFHLSEGDDISSTQYPSMGCSIKWA